MQDNIKTIHIFIYLYGKSHCFDERKDVYEQVYDVEEQICTKFCLKKRFYGD
jgi:hypothetical protein